MIMLRTKEQKRVLCKTCPYAKAANLLGDSVILLIVRELLVSEKCFSDLEKALSGISTRTISDKLKYLEQESVVIKTEIQGKPNRVYYSLSEKGKALRPLSRALIGFGEKWLG